MPPTRAQDGATIGYGTDTLGLSSDRIVTVTLIGNGGTVQPFTDSGTPLIAEFAVEPHQGQLSMTFESAGGRTKNGPRNPDYVAALVLLLSRLAERSAVIVSAVVESKKTVGLPLHKRSLTDAPIRLSPTSDVGEVRKRLTSAQGRIGQTEDAPKRATTANACGCSSTCLDTGSRTVPD
ncbi:hypothetical protein [Actinokineospora sp.]|uniref:hypothetical protein n=1 Tax=Actinokineospora sp. TaxID=1872133 RepID=UPI003D6AF473